VLPPLGSAGPFAQVPPCWFEMLTRLGRLERVPSGSSPYASARLLLYSAIVIAKDQAAIM